MVCKKCGKSVDDGALFCQACGEKISSGESAGKKETKKKKGFGFSVIAIMVCIFAALIVVGCLALISAPVCIDVEKWVTVTFEGYEGYGAAFWDVDREDFIDEYSEKLPTVADAMEKARKKDYEGLQDWVLESCMECGVSVSSTDKKDTAKILYDMLFYDASFEGNEDLKNGDEVTFVLGYPSGLDEEELEEFREVFGITLKNTEITYTASELKVPEEFDPFEEVVVSYSGAAPRGQVLLENYPDNGLTYTINAPDIVSNGDEFTVSVSYGGYGIDQYLNTYRKVPSSTEKTYVVSDLPQYMTSSSQIPEATLLEMQQQAVDVIKGTSSGWKTGYTQDISYIGNYMLFAKKPEAEPQNMIVLLYKVHYENTYRDYNGVDQPYSKDYYFYVNWNDLVLNEDGTCSYDKNAYGKAQDSFLVGTGVFKDVNIFYSGPKPYNEYTATFTGYQTLDEIYSHFITRNIEFYKFEENVQK